MLNFYDMFEYKNAQFYTEYFKNLEDFSVVEEFKESDDYDEKNLLVGTIEVLNTIHPLVIRVEIPKTFPHNQLTFRTKSLSGYPHLIHTGKIKYGDWFCLNTPFAETPEEQLNLEVERLKEWILRRMHKDLPPIIEDPKVKRALAFTNAYEWENLDEIQAFSPQAMLTFVGDFHNDLDFFKNNIGHINCIKTEDNRFYAVTNENITNHKLPYIIVDEYPSSADFIKLKEQYGWDEDTCNHLTPELKLGIEWKTNNIQHCPFLHKNQLSKKEKLGLITKIKEELKKEDSYLFEGRKPNNLGNHEIIPSNNKILVHPSQKPAILEELNNIKDIILGKKTEARHIDFDDDIDIDSIIEEHDYKYHHFIFGVKKNDKIDWYIYFTNRATEQKEIVSYDLGIKTVVFKRAIAYPYGYEKAQIITQEMFFGRGAFSENLISKKVAIIGLGAIGSMVATALAHSGVYNIGLWDNDIVEPGNICRSSYSLSNLGDSKVESIKKIIENINPYIKTEHVKTSGCWYYRDVNNITYYKGSFYDNINYNDQNDAIKEIENYDLIIDCTGSNEMLHFLSYAVKNTDIISLCITNKAKELLCITNKNGNPFELRKTYLSRIEQDTKNFYIEGSGCYSPTFLAKQCDISALVNLAIKDIDKVFSDNSLMTSTIYSYDKRGIVADKLITYKLDGYDITLNISSETLYDAEEILDVDDLIIGHALGCYSSDGTQIMLTHIIESNSAVEILEDAFNTSKGIIDYIGDFCYSGPDIDTYNETSLNIIAHKAADSSINTNNPLLIVRNPDSSLSFFLYINNELIKFRPLN